MNTQISFIILSWNSEKYLKRCFDSIIAKCEEEQITYEIIGIDNGSTDKSVSIINKYTERYPHNFKKIVLSQNRGTSYSRNLGLKKATGIHICIIDSDTEILSGQLSLLLERLDNNKEIGIYAPQLLLPDGSIQNSVKKFPTFLVKLSKLIPAICNIKITNIDFYNNFPFTSEISVDSAISACWFFKKELLLQVGFLDEKIFYSPEDIDYCLRVCMINKKIIYYPHFKILHHTQQISHKRSFSSTSIRHFLGLFYYFGKHGGWFSTKAIYKKINNIKDSKVE